MCSIFQGILKWNIIFLKMLNVPQEKGIYGRNLRKCHESFYTFPWSQLSFVFVHSLFLFSHFFFSGSFSSSLPDISQCHSLNLALNHWNHCWSLSQTAPEARKSKIWRTHPGSVTLDTSAQAPVHSEQYFIYIKTQS